ncbi:hypothetical protein BDV35DRAFT_349386 [Aspergillus flavus]|uniref:Uncharacterized protein n=1 Tax=Aspergillus flavus TaxID=5059 RepID=A0A5N6H168_ASPFL|nr:hypothetical protein BDV35DRAFT_349386 [Aspergillus flavus]
MATNPRLVYKTTDSLPCGLITVYLGCDGFLGMVTCWFLRLGFGPIVLLYLHTFGMALIMTVFFSWNMTSCHAMLYTGLVGSSRVKV